MVSGVNITPMGPITLWPRLRVPHPVSPGWNMPETRNHTHPMSSDIFVQLANMWLLLGVLGHLKDDPEDIVLPHLNTTQLPFGFACCSCPTGQ